MKDQVRVVLAQVQIDSLEPAKNLDRLLRTCERAAAGHPDLVIFPELANLGYVKARDREFGARYLGAMEPVPGPFTDALAQAAREHGMYLIVGLAERHPTIPFTGFDSAVLIGPSGGIVGVQRKLHLAGEERHYFAPGREIGVFATALGVLAMPICYDNYFPEVARTAALRGAEIVCGLFSVTDRDEWRDRLVHLATVRAYENMQHVAFVNRVGSNHGVSYGGESVVAAPPGMVLARGPRLEETLVEAVLLAETMAAERAYRPVFADRRPAVYDLGDPAQGD